MILGFSPRLRPGGLAVLGGEPRPGPPGPTFLLRDDFASGEAAPLASPRVCEPGPGTLVVTGVDKASVVDGCLRLRGQNSYAAGPVVTGDALDRVAGRALYHKRRRESQPDGGVGDARWGFSPGASQSPDEGWVDGVPYVDGAPVGAQVQSAVGSFDEYVVVLRSPGTLHLARAAGAPSWALLAAGTARTQTPVYAFAFARFDQDEYDTIRVADLGAAVETALAALSPGDPVAGPAAAALDALALP